MWITRPFRVSVSFMMCFRLDEGRCHGDLLGSKDDVSVSPRNCFFPRFLTLRVVFVVFSHYLHCNLHSISL